MGYLKEMPESISDDELVTFIKAPVSKLTPEEAKEIAQTHPFVVLGGLHRSGTTLLFRMLREHPEISGFANNQDANEWLGAEDEGQYLQSVYPPAIFWGGPGKFAFSPEANLTEESEFLTPETRPGWPWSGSRSSISRSVFCWKNLRRTFSGRASCRAFSRTPGS
jgi:hypothetical protein